MHDRTNFFVTSSWNQVEGTSFSGYCFYKDSLIFQQDGYEAFCAESNGDPDLLSFGDGRFSIVRNHGDEVVARTDDFGQDILFYYCDGEYWAVSNSFRDLFYHLNKHGIYLTPDFDVMRLGRIKHAIFQSLFTNETYFKEIKILPVDKILKIKKNTDNAYYAKFTKCNSINEYKENLSEEEVASRLQQYCVHSLRKMKTILDASDKILCDISGGNDSRIILALLLASGGDKSSIRFASNRNWKNDYEIFTILAKKFGLKMNNAGHYPRSISSTDAYELWKRGNLGVYYPIYFPKHNQTTDAFHFHGAGGGGIRNTYGYGFYELFDYLESSSDTEKQDLDAALKKIGLEFERLRIDAVNSQALTFHYRNFRSRFHFGRNTFRNLNGFLFTPLYSLELSELASYYADKPFNQIYFDLLTLLKPELRDIPFDTTKKNFTELNFKLGEKIADSNLDFNVESMRVFGDTSFETHNLKKEVLDEQMLLNLMSFDINKYAETIIKTGIYSQSEISAVQKKITTKEFFNNSRAGIEFSHMVAIGEFVYSNNKNKEFEKEWNNQENQSGQDEMALALFEKTSIDKRVIKKNA